MTLLRRCGMCSLLILSASLVFANPKSTTFNAPVDDVFRAAQKAAAGAGGPGFDLAGISDAAGALSFAPFAKGGKRQCPHWGRGGKRGNTDGTDPNSKSLAHLCRPRACSSPAHP